MERSTTVRARRWVRILLALLIVAAMQIVVSFVSASPAMADECSDMKITGLTAAGDPATPDQIQNCLVGGDAAAKANNMTGDCATAAPDAPACAQLKADVAAAPVTPVAPGQSPDNAKVTQAVNNYNNTLKNDCTNPNNPNPAACSALINSGAMPAPVATAPAPASFNPANIIKLSGWLEWMALMACVIGIFVSASLWALGSKGQNPGQELTGKKGLILCCTAAFFVGALPGMLTFLDGQAKQADLTGVTGSASPGGAAANTGPGGNNPPPAQPVNQVSQPSIANVCSNDPKAANPCPPGTVVGVGVQDCLFAPDPQACEKLKSSLTQTDQSVCLFQPNRAGCPGAAPLTPPPNPDPAPPNPAPAAPAVPDAGQPPAAPAAPSPAEQARDQRCQGDLAGVYPDLAACQAANPVKA